METVEGARGVSVDEALSSKCVGEFGLQQRLQLLVAGGAWVVAALQTFLLVFSSIDPLRAGQLQCVKPGDKDCAAALAEPYPDVCALDRESWEWTSQGASIVSDFDLVCGRAWLLQLSHVFFFAGTLLGYALFHFLSSRFGSRRLLYTAVALSGVSGIMACTAPKLLLYTAFRALTGVSVGGMGLASYLVATGPVGPAWRGFMGMLLQPFFSLGACLAALLAWVLPSWRLQTLLAALGALLFMPTWTVVVESPQWLLLRGRKGEATAALAAIAFANRTHLPTAALADPTGVLIDPQRRFRDLLANGRLRKRMAVAAAAWFAVGAAYFGAALLADDLSPAGWLKPERDGSTFVTALTGFSYEVPGIAAAWLAVERGPGRKYTLMACLLQGGLFLVLAGVTRDETRRAMAVGARFGVAGAAATLHLITFELFPEAVRAHGMAVGAYAARLGACLAPVFLLVGARLHSPLVPLLVFGSLCLAASVLAMLLPETLGAPLFDTIQELNAAAIKRSRSWTVSLRQVFRPRLRGSLRDEVLPLESPRNA